jgi:hypothetical protein
MRADP